MIKVALCDDSEKSYNHLKYYLHKYEEVCKEHIHIQYYSSAEELLFSYQSQFDILFMETVINHKSGIDAAKSIRKLDENVCIIFVTMYRTFGSESYQIHASNYLIKPLTYKTLEMAMNQVYIEFLKKKHYIIASSSNKIIKIPIDNILYISYFNHKLTFHLFSGETAETYGSYKGLFEHEGTNCLFQIHKSYVINMLWIEQIINKTIYLKNILQGFPVSKQRWQDFSNTYKNFSSRGSP